MSAQQDANRQDHQHRSIKDAASNEVHHALSGHIHKHFHSKHTVPPEATIDGEVHELNTGGGVVLGVGHRPQVADHSGPTQVLCGPLLNYRRMSDEHTNAPKWHGSVLLVTKPGQQPANMVLRMMREDGSQHQLITGTATYTSSVRPELLYEDPKGAFWRFRLEVHFQTTESRWEYSIADAVTPRNSNTTPTITRVFAIPAKTACMRIMFHSCNGFSTGTDTAAWSGAALWNDVLRHHEQKPFHLMIGGGDQIYNDEIRISGPLKPWTEISLPHKRKEFPFNEDLRAQCDTWYFGNYVKWYGSDPFAEANGQIPQLNIWDDHDIIDGYGSYTDSFMQGPVFRGIGGVAHKYYRLFQHHVPPPKSTFTTDAPQTVDVGEDGTTAADAIQLRDSWVLISDPVDPSYIVGARAGPYVEEKSHSIYCQLDARMAFLGIDARTERTRHQINYPDTYDLIFDRASKELAAANGRIKHLILLLGVPIAYPRLQWLENILHSPIIGPLRFLNKRFGLAGGFFNAFDGQVDLLDDLDDHYTAHQHKKERTMLVQRLQTLSKTHHVRINILSGDVHLGALGRFYSNPKLDIKVEHDWRFMANVVSSAITNKPPPMAVANLLARRNKIHHLDADTDETLLDLFDKDPADGKENVKVTTKTNKANLCTMPSRNYAIIRECAALDADGTEHADIQDDAAEGLPSEKPRPVNGLSTAGIQNTGTVVDGANANSATRKAIPNATQLLFTRSKNPRKALHIGEHKSGTAHPAASPLATAESSISGLHGLDISLQVEITSGHPSGATRSYGFSVPALNCAGHTLEDKRR